MASQTARTSALAALTATWLLAAPVERPSAQPARLFPPPRPGVPIEAIVAEGTESVWAATAKGLFRFDGVRYHEIASEPLVGIAMTSDGWLWTAGPRGLAARKRFEERRFLSRPVTAIAASGRQIVAEAGGIFRGGLDGFKPLGVSANAALSADGRGRVWFGCGTEICVLEGDGSLRRLGREDGVPEERWLGAIEDNAGVLWAWNGPRRLRVADGKSTVHAPWKASNMRMGASVDSKGRIWFDGGEWILDGRMPDFSPGREVFLRQVFAWDGDGRMWTAGVEGLALMAERQWLDRWPTGRFPVGAQDIVRVPRLGLLASTRQGVLRFDAEKQDWRELPGTFQGAPAHGAIGSSDGGTWALLDGRGIVRVDDAGRDTGAVYRGGFRGRDFRRLFRDSAGRLWVGAKDGLYLVDERALQLKRIPLPGGVRDAVAFARGPDGREWMGSEAGIARLVGDAWEVVIPPGKLVSPRVRSIAVGPHSTIWVSYRTQAPFSRFTSEGGEWVRQDFPAADGYGPVETRALLVDRRGWVWRGTPDGLFVSDGVRMAARDWIRFDHAQNLRPENINPFGLFEDEDGSIWVATDGGVAHMYPDPAWFGADGRPPRVTAIRAAGEQRLWPASGDPPLAGNRVEIDVAWWPAALPRDFALEYRLTESDAKWQVAEAGTIRLDELASGNHVLEMRVSPGGGSAVFLFAVARPPFWWWWIPVSVGSIAAGGWTWWRRRLKTEYWKAKEAFLANAGASVAADWCGALLAGRYEVRKRLGDGGFATVYLARDRQTGNEVAVKVLAAGEPAERQRKRFGKEVAALRRISHRGIVTLLDSGWLSDSEPFLAMTYLRGPTLRELLRAGPPSRVRAADWLRQIGDALREAHCRGVLHRDLKPENVIVLDPGMETERVVVVDFGAAAFLHDDSQRTLVVGSFPYLAPEQVQGRSSPSSDIYSMTAIAFELLTGVRYASLVDGTEAGLRGALPGFGESLTSLLAAGLAYVPEDRPSEIGEFAFALAQAIEDL